MTPKPSGTVAFLFTDIEGSTVLAQRHPDKLPALLTRHREILKRSIESHQGYIFQVVGDSFSAAFHSASDALGAALDAQIQLHYEDWGDMSAAWGWVQPEVAKTTLVCSYDRAGMDWSEISTQPRTAREFAAELHILLEKANEPGPYVLVGHSMGGYTVRVFAHDYPEEGAGVVLGWLYWRRGLESAIIAHFIADLMISIVLPALLA